MSQKSKAWELIKFLWRAGLREFKPYYFKFHYVILKETETKLTKGSSVCVSDKTGGVWFSVKLCSM